MLASLSIRNFVLIEDAELEFGPGLTVLTGETGAGKTLLTRALGLLMGERAEDGLVGGAGDEAIIEGVFLADAATLDGAAEQVRDLVLGPAAELDEIAGDSDARPHAPLEVIVTRRLSREGRNRCYLNGSTVTLAVMGDLVGRLVSFAGQHEHRRLLEPAYQLGVLDQWAGPETLDTAERYRLAFRRAEETARALDEAERSQESRLRETRLLRYEIDELEAAGISQAEEQALVAEQRVLARAEELLLAAGGAADLLSGERDGPDAAGLLAQAGAHLGRLTGVDQTLDALTAELQDMQYGLAELTRSLRSYLGGVSVDPERLQAVEARLRLYGDLARKYGGSTATAVEHLRSAQERLLRLEQSEDDLRGLGEARAAQCALALDLAGRLSSLRQEAVARMEEAVRRQLADLGMPAATFEVALRHRPGWEGLRDSGAESAEFLLSANPGQPARNLAATASGGELSRVLLALKCALAGASGDETLVFDEVDAGIGGRTAVAVANKLRELSCRSQAIVVTHLATVAAHGDKHYLITKESRLSPPAGVAAGGTGSAKVDDVGAADHGGLVTTAPSATTTRLILLAGDLVVEELCRMMGGHPDSVEAMAHARELRDSAQGAC